MYWKWRWSFWWLSFCWRQVRKPLTKSVFLQQEVFRARKKRDRKSRHGGDTGLDDERLEAELSSIRRPQLTDILPCVIVRFAMRVIAGVPSSVRLVLELYREWWQTPDEEPPDEPGWLLNYDNMASLLLLLPLLVLPDRLKYTPD